MSPLFDYQCGNCYYVEYDVLCSDPLDMQLTYRCPRCTLGMMTRSLGKPNFHIKGHSSKNNYSYKPEVNE